MKPAAGCLLKLLLKLLNFTVSTSFTFTVASEDVCTDKSEILI